MISFSKRIINNRMITLKTHSVNETKELGRKLGKLLKAGDLVALDGDLGAGKTAMTGGIAEGMGINARISSPTFTIVNEYPGALTLYHFDTYRLTGEDDFLDSGLDEYFDAGGVCVIEWSNIIDGLLPENTIRIAIVGTGDVRTICIDAPEAFDKLIREALDGGL